MATTATSWLAKDASVDGSIHIAAPILQRKRLYRITKRCFDIVCSFFALVILSAPMLVIALVVALDSPGRADLPAGTARTQRKAVLDL